MPLDANALQLLQYKRQPAHAPAKHQRQQQEQERPTDMSLPEPMLASNGGAFYDLVWETGMLGLRFTPSANDEPVVCQITENAPENVRRSRVAVGDVVVAVQVHSIGAPMAPIATMQELLPVFKHEELPITVRFRSRSHVLPESIALGDIARSYTYMWPPNQPLGVSLAMDPCTLHTIITSIDRERISPEFLPLEPLPGDILVSVRDLENKADLDIVRFDQAVETLRSFPRPCKLTFARLHEEVGYPLSRSSSQDSSASGDRERARSTSSGQRPAPSPRPPSHATNALVPPAPFSEPTRRPQPRRPAPLMKRQSFSVEGMKQQETLSKEEAKKKAQRDARFYKIMYSGGHIGLVLHDAQLELKDKQKKANGYYAVIKKIPNKRTLAGLEQASEGDELIAIGTHDLQHVPFDDVQREITGIREPTPLVFQRKPMANVSIGASLVDGLLLFLI